MATACAAVADRPLSGLVANKVVGGPATWRSHRALHRFSTVSTVVIGLVSFVNLAAQVALYRWSDLAWPGLLHVLMGPSSAAITALSVLPARRTVTRARDGGATPASQHVSGQCVRYVLRSSRTEFAAVTPRPRYQVSSFTVFAWPSFTAGRFFHSGLDVAAASSVFAGSP